MEILITGGAGFLGKKLAAQLLKQGALNLDGQGAEPISRIVLFDIAAAAGLPDDPRLDLRTGDITNPETVRSLIGPDTRCVFHLAAVVSADAEQNFDLGMAVNLDGTRHLLEACRQAGARPRMVFSSSVAVYGGKLPAVGQDATPITPSISYGVQKFMCELLVGEYSRKGFLDGRSLRLPTIVVRPGKPNKAASTFASSILREPLNGLPAHCPVEPSTRMYILSPRRVIAALIRAMELPAAAFGENRALTLPGISASIAEMVQALEQVAGKEASALIDWTPDPAIRKIVDTWMTDFDAVRGREMGFEADGDMLEIIRAHVEDEMPG